MFCSLNPTSNLCGTPEEKEKEKEKVAEMKTTEGKSAVAESGTAGKQKGISTVVVVRKPTCKLTSEMLKGLRVVRMLIQRNKGSWVAVCLGSLVDRLSHLEMKDRENQCVRG